MKVFYYICEFLYTATIVRFMLTLTGAVWEPRVGERKRKAIEAVVVITIAGANVYNRELTAILFSNLAVSVNIALLSLVSIIIYRCRFWDALCFISILRMGLALIDFFIQTFAYILLEEICFPPYIFLSITLQRGIYLIIWVLALSVLVFLVHMVDKRRMVVVDSYLNKGWFLVPILFICMVYFQRIYIQMVSEYLIYRWWLFMLGGMLLVLAILGFMAINKEKERYWLLQKKTEMLEYNYKEMQRVYKEKEILLHDVKKHMAIIQEMAKANKEQNIVSYLNDMDHVLQKGRNQDLVNHELINLILNRKFQEAEKSDISVQYELDDLKKLILKPIEVCALFSNMLDNAIEANKALKIGQMRWIRLVCVKKERMLVILLSNPMPEGKICFIRDIPQTTKKDKKNHGLGMRSIKQVIDFYGGHMQIETKEGMYKLMVYLQGFVE